MPRSTKTTVLEAANIILKTDRQPLETALMRIATSALNDMDTSAMLCGVAGIAPAVVDNAAAYIDHWRKRISADPKLVVSAGARAQRAADYVLGVTFDDKPVSGEQPKSEPVLVRA